MDFPWMSHCYFLCYIKAVLKTDIFKVYIGFQGLATLYVSAVLIFWYTKQLHIQDLYISDIYIV
jgi:uncharacterized membrane protein YhhN